MDRNTFFFFHRKSDGDGLLIRLDKIVAVWPMFDDCGNEYSQIKVLGESEPYDVTNTFCDIANSLPWVGGEE